MGYAKDIQRVEDTIREFTTIGSGTIATVTSQQYIQSLNVNRPTKNYRNYVLVFSNKTGQSINSVNVYGFNSVNNSPLPNTSNTVAIYLKTATPSNGGTGNQACVDLTSEEPNPFLAGACRFQFNLGAVTTGAGSIDWVLIGY